MRWLVGRRLVSSSSYRDHMMMIFCWCEWVRSEYRLLESRIYDMGTKPSPAREQRLLHSLVRWAAPAACHAGIASATLANPVRAFAGKLLFASSSPPSLAAARRRVLTACRRGRVVLRRHGCEGKERIHFNLRARTTYRHSLCHHQHYSHLHC